jgi:cation diffusion facilitator family transporter
MVEFRLKLPILLSILAAAVTLVLKWTAYLLTGSAGLLSDAAETAVNLMAALTALFSLWYASRPVDPTHTYGHEKIEYLSSGLEGMLILVAAAGLAWYGAQRLLNPRPLEALGVGVTITLVASLINFVVAQILLRVGKKHQSIVLEADGRHLMSDVWTSCGVVAGLGLVWLTDHRYLWVDAVVGLIVAVAIAYTGFDLVWRSFNGLMDHALPLNEQGAVRRAIEGCLQPGMDYHALRTRRAGSRRFADFHLLVPGALSVRRAHDVTAEIEEAVRAALPGIEVTVHIEPIEDRKAYEDSELVPIEQAARRAASEAVQAEAPAPPAPSKQ